MPEARELSVAITQYFGYRARAIGLELNELFRVGGRALAIGVTVLSFSVITGQTVSAALAPHPVGRVIEESLLIFGWVANWRPIEIFLYEWWPIIRRRNWYRRISAAQVDLKPYKRNDQGRQPNLESGSPAPPRLTRLGRLGTRRAIHLAPDTNFVDVLQEVGRVFIDAIRAGTLEFVPAVAAGQETNAKGAGPLRS